MAIAFTILEHGEEVMSGVKLLPEEYDASWHSAVYNALAFTIEQQQGRLGSAPIFLTDDERVVLQMEGKRGVNGGHYVEAREDAIAMLVGEFPQACPEFKWVSQEKNLALPLCLDLLTKRGITPWTYKRDRNEDIEMVLASGSVVKWSEIVDTARNGRVVFRIGGDRNKIEFHLKPDIFPHSFVLAWTTVEEREGGPFMDCRVRSSEPDDFLSRIRSLASVKTIETSGQRQMDNNKIVLDREELGFGKYTNAYAGISSDQMEGLLWLLGEWSIRGDIDHPRAQAAKKALLEFSHSPLTRDEVGALMRGAR